MARPCSICNHPDRDKIESMLLKGKSHRRVAKAFGVGKSAVQNHKLSHMIQEMAASLAGRNTQTQSEISGQDTVIAGQEPDGMPHGMPLLTVRPYNLETSGNGLLEEIENLRRAAYAILQCADNKTRIMAIREASRLLELQGKVHGELQSGSVTNNILIAPVAQDFIKRLLERFADEPDVRIRLAEAAQEVITAQYTVQSDGNEAQVPVLTEVSNDGH